MVFTPLVVMLSLMPIGIPANLFLEKSRFSAGFASSATVIQAFNFLFSSLMFATVSLVNLSADKEPLASFLFNESIFSFK